MGPLWTQTSLGALIHRSSGIRYTPWQHLAHGISRREPIVHGLPGGHPSLASASFLAGPDAVRAAGRVVPAPPSRSPSVGLPAWVW